MCIIVHTKTAAYIFLLVTKSFWDKIGIGLSGLCAVHCLLVPVFVSLLPLWPAAEATHEWTHPVLLLLILPTIYYAIRKSKNAKNVSVFLYSGLGVITLSWLLHDFVGLWWESFITIIGSALLVRGHWLNYQNHSARSCSVTKDF
ncbi:MerC domain-containing protein [Fodinibius salicampi]|uniref:MerC domain-containing protein n=1 Tax=Fodinibius salicampi TaxID=1920655 RepID=UPI003313E4D0